MSKDGKRPPGASGSGNSPPHKRGRREDEETPMEVDDGEGEVSSTSQHVPRTVTQSSSTQTDPTSSVQPSTDDVGEGSGSVAPAGGNLGESSESDAGTAAKIPGSSGNDRPAEVKDARITLVAKKGCSQSKPQHEYKTYSDSVVDQYSDIKPLPAKPDCLLPSNSSIDFNEKVVDVPPPSSPPKPDNTGQPTPAASQALEPQPPEPAHAPAQRHALPNQQPAEIVKNYPDGRREVIEVVNADHVRRIARAGQVIRPIESGLSASHPQTSRPHALSTASLPTSLGVPSTLPPSLAPGQEDAAGDNPQNVADVKAGDGNVAQAQPDDRQIPDVSDSSAPQKKSPKGDGVKKSTKKKTKEEKYQSHSAPALSQPAPTASQPAEMHLLSTPILSMTKILKKKVISTLELLDMKVELDRIAANLRVIEEESNLSDEDKKGDKDSDFKDGHKKGGKD